METTIRAGLDEFGVGNEGLEKSRETTTMLDLYTRCLGIHSSIPF